MPKCVIHSRKYPLWNGCPECNKDEIMKNAADELFKACEQARDAIHQVNVLAMVAHEPVVKKRLAKAEQTCDEAMRLALTGE